MDQSNEEVNFFTESASSKFPSVVHHQPSFMPSDWADEPFIRHPGGNQSLFLNMSLEGDDLTEVMWTIEVSNGTLIDLFVLNSTKNPKQGLFFAHEPVPAVCLDCSAAVMHQLEISPHMFDVNFTIVVEAINGLVLIEVLYMNNHNKSIQVKNNANDSGMVMTNLNFLLYFRQFWKKHLPMGKVWKIRQKQALPVGLQR